VQFYDDDAFLVRSVADYIGVALRGGEGAVLIATPAHRDAIEQRLNAAQINVAMAQARGQYIALDAAETLSKFMVCGSPDESLFRGNVVPLICRSGQGSSGVRAFGEMVALLWAQGNSTGAIRLEQLWNDLGKSHEFSLLCAYPMQGFQGVGNSDGLVAVCNLHTHIIPSESYDRTASTDTQLRTITLLQQKAASLESEMAERRQAESALREQQTKLTMAVAIAQLGVWELDLLTNNLTCSDQCKAHLGLSPDDAVTYTRLFEIMHPDDRETVQNTLRNAIAASGDHTTEYRVIDRDGHVRWISSMGRCFRNGEQRMLGVTLDITERKRASEVLERAVAERTSTLQEIIGDLEAFSYSVSHDMRTPLRSMQGYAGIMLQECADEVSPEARVCLERIVASAERMDRLIQDVLTFSHIARPELQTEPVDLDELARAIIDSYPDLQWPRATVAIEGKLPCVLGNPAALTQCLSNLLANAVKFVAPGTLPCIRIWADVLGPETVRVRIQDNGIGIPSEAHEKIFTIFYRFSKKYEGTGIGLAIVKKAAEPMGGAVGLSSAPGKGSTFWLDLKTEKRS